MYLEKLEIQGFKSFANKNTLVFPGALNQDKKHGITAIVGPNGSGKSNIADAVRWVLGEQSMKTLRGKKSEDIIFSGSETHGKLGMAEVSLYLNNEDRKAPIDYSQIVLTRRVYRDGNSEYILNNSRVRLLDIEMLLAKASFGQKTYSVIGQGMVEGFLNTSLSERKEFFDEATGVKQYQIKRDTSLGKLKLSLENLAQAQMLLVEIEPRLKSLTRQVNKLQKKEEIERTLREVQLNYYGKIWHEVKDKFDEVNRNFLEMEKTKLDKEKKMAGYNRELAEMEKDSQTSREYDEWQRNLAELQNQKDALNRQLSRLEAQLELKMEASGQFDLAWLTNRRSVLAKDLAAVKEELSVLAREISVGRSQYEGLVREKDVLTSKAGELNRSLVSNATGLNSDGAKRINAKLKRLLARLEETDAEADIEKIKEAVRAVRAELQEVLGETENFQDREKLESIQNDLVALSATREELSMRMNETGIRNSSLSERERLLKEKERGIEQELDGVEDKLKKYQNQVAEQEIEADKKRVSESLAANDKDIEDIRKKIGEFSDREKEKRARLFEVQKKMQALQNELNSLTGSLNDLKVESARHETRLEDMETEIRNELGGMRDVEQNKVSGPVDMEAAQAKIHNLKRQLDMIGSLDPEIEKEYIQTKERYDFLSNQVEDLTGTISSLEKIIKELDITIKEKFDKEFKLISKKFEEYFKILFNGGKAQIIKVTTEEMLTEEEKERAAAQAALASQPAEGAPAEPAPVTGEEIDPRIKATNEIYKKIKLLQKYNATGLAGVEITATPPGKKIQSVSLLSGGERALTAIALICAIISANPSPFVVLDEVDAALDEANSERLAKILDDLSLKTQFIVITHNRASMRRADILYGVTMQNDGISKLLSVKLEDVKARNEM